MSKLFEQMNDELFAAGTVPDKEEVERQEAEEKRTRNLARVKPAITPEDVDAIIHDKLDVTLSPALHFVRMFHLTVRGVRKSRDGRPFRFLVLLGNTGRGKTVAACSLLAAVGGYYVSAPDFHYRATSRIHSVRGKLEELHVGNLVVLDDLGTEDADGRMEACVWDLVNARQTKGKMTVLTGNMTRAEFGQRYGERTLRRIEHQGAIVELQGDDLRRKPL